MDQSEVKDFKVIIAIKDDPQNGKSYPIQDLLCKTQIGNEEIKAPYPYTEPQLIDLDYIDQKTNFSLQFVSSDEQNYGSVQIPIPHEVQFKETVQLNSKFEVESLNIKGSYLIIILNKNVFKNNVSIQEQNHSFQSQPEIEYSQVNQSKHIHQENQAENQVISSGIQQNKGKIQPKQKSNNQISQSHLFRPQQNVASSIQQRKHSIGKVTTIIKHNEITSKKISTSSSSTTPLRQRGGQNTPIAQVQQKKITKEQNKEPLNAGIKKKDEGKTISNNGNAAISNQNVNNNNKMERYEKKLKYIPQSEYQVNSWAINKKNEKHQKDDQEISKQVQSVSNSSIINDQQINGNSKNIFQPPAFKQEEQFSYIQNSKEQSPITSVLQVGRASLLQSQRNSHSFGETSDLTSQQKWEIADASPKNLNLSSKRPSTSNINSKPDAKKYPSTSEFPQKQYKSVSHSPIKRDTSPVPKRSYENSLSPSGYQIDKYCPSPMRRSDSPIGVSPSNQKINPLSVLMNLEGSRRESKHQAEQLRVSIYTLDNKVKSLGLVEQENEDLREELKKSEESRKELQKALERQIQFESNYKEDLDKIRSKVLEEKNELNIRLGKKNDEINELARQMDLILEELRNTQMQNIKLNEKLNSYNSLEAVTDSYKKELNLLNSMLIKHNSEFHERFSQLHQGIALLEEEKSILSRQKADLAIQVGSLSMENTQLMEQSIEKQYEIDSLLRKLSLQTSFEDGLKINQVHIDAINLELREEKRLREEIMQKLVDSQKELSQITNEREEDFKRYKEDVDLLRKTLDKQQETINKQSEALVEINANGIQEKQKDRQEVIFKKIIQDLELSLQSEKNRRERSELEVNESRRIYKEQEAVLSSQSQEIEQLKQSIRELATMVDQGEEYARSLRQLLLRKRDLGEDQYVPEAEDQVDRCLANYINSDRLQYPAARLLLQRESQGVYQFGSKRIFVKAESDKVYVRVGGGFISLEEFLDLQIPSEIEKLEKNHPLKKMSQNFSLNKKLSQSRQISEIKEQYDTPIQDSLFK